jgi:bifunctional non-homologous end joining protein LigD
MALHEYRRKRDFARTPEPSGQGESAPAGRRFVVHKHAATHLHYDLRLEIDGVLRCWAVPKGPSLDPAERRLAVQTEDHPLEYLEFEGVIPAGEYGGGAMIVWDRGHWEPEGDLAKSLHKGQLKLRLTGEKLEGRWALVKMKPRPGEPDRNWLLIKERSENVRPLSQGDVLQELPHSVLSGRTVEELAGIAALEQSSARDPSTPHRAGRQLAFPIEAGRIPKAVAAAMPDRIEPQLASTAQRLPDGDQWLHEMKLDGYRLLCFVENGKVRLLTRRHNNWTSRFPYIAAAAAKLPARSVVLDGEVVGLLPSGVSSFAVLQSALKSGKTRPLVYFVFDLLYLDGQDLRRAALVDRKQALSELLRNAPTGPIQYVDHIEGTAEAFFGECQRLGLEGIISKRKDRPYREGRSQEWLKSKCVLRDEFVVGGFTEPEGARAGLGSLLVGHFAANCELHYAGRVGTGFDDAALVDLRRRLGALEVKRNPFAAIARDKVKRGTHWVKPQVVVQVQYAGWSSDGLLWHPVFQGEREDVAAASVVREPALAAGAKPEASRRKPKDVPAGDVLSQEQLAPLSGLQMTHPGRVMYQDPLLTKLDLARYYAAIADWILPHVAGRPLSLVRCPDGQGTEAFYQKRSTAGMPEAIQRVMVEDVEHLVVKDLAGLLSLVQFAVLEIHLWGSRIDRVERPDRLVFDLDPGPGVTWPRIIDVALQLRELLSEAGLVSFVKTTGSKGLHVVVPIERRHGWDVVQRFCQAVAKRFVAAHPRELTINSARQAREGRIYVDYRRNIRGATAVAPYSTRNRPGAPVSVPLEWHELKQQRGPAEYTVANVVQRLASLRSDPWGKLCETRQSLTARVLRSFGL